MPHARSIAIQPKLSGSDIVRFLDRLERNHLSRGQALEILFTLQDRTLDAYAITTFVRHIRARYPCRQARQSHQAVNIVGTGGGRATFNISTTAAFVAAAAGAVVIKSGSGSYTSKCGALDLLKALGIDLNLDFETFERMVADIGLGFVNPAWYAPVLRRLAVTILPDTFKSAGGFVNVAGPLLAPVDVGARLIGVRSKAMIDSMAVCVEVLGMGDAIVCWSDQGLDEFCSLGCNYFRRVTADGIGPLETDTAGSVQAAQPAALEGGTPMENAAITHGLLAGRIGGVKLDTVLRNAAFILILAGNARTVDEGVALGAEAVCSGRALKTLDAARSYRAAQRRRS